MARKANKVKRELVIHLLKSGKKPYEIRAITNMSFQNINYYREIMLGKRK